MSGKVEYSAYPPATCIRTPSLIANKQIQSAAYFLIAWMLFRLKSVCETSNALLVHAPLMKHLLPPSLDIMGRI